MFYPSIFPSGNSSLRSTKYSAVHAFSEIYRKSGDPYYMHLIRVADYVEKFYHERKNLISMKKAAYWHDSIEDLNVPYELLSYYLGSDVAKLVLEVTNNPQAIAKIGKCAYLYQKIQRLSSDAFAIKLCDSLDNTDDLLERDKSFRQKQIMQKIAILEGAKKRKYLSDPDEQIMILIKHNITLAAALDSDTPTDTKKKILTL